MTFLEQEELTEDMKEKLIEKVVVYLGNRIEIAWKFEGHSVRGMALVKQNIRLQAGLIGFENESYVCTPLIQSCLSLLIGV